VTVRTGRISRTAAFSSFLQASGPTANKDSDATATAAVRQQPLKKNYAPLSPFWTLCGWADNAGFKRDAMPALFQITVIRSGVKDLKKVEENIFWFLLLLCLSFKRTAKSHDWWSSGFRRAWRQHDGSTHRPAPAP